MRLVSTQSHACGHLGLQEAQLGAESLLVSVRASVTPWLPCPPAHYPLTQGVTQTEEPMSAFFIVVLSWSFNRFLPQAISPQNAALSGLVHLLFPDFQPQIFQTSPLEQFSLYPCVISKTHYSLSFSPKDLSALLGEFKWEFKFKFPPLVKQKVLETEITLFFLTSILLFYPRTNFYS